MLIVVFFCELSNDIVTSTIAMSHLLFCVIYCRRERLRVPRTNTHNMPHDTVVLVSNTPRALHEGKSLPKRYEVDGETFIISIHNEIPARTAVHACTVTVVI